MLTLPLISYGTQSGETGDETDQARGVPVPAGERRLDDGVAYAHDRQRLGDALRQMDPDIRDGIRSCRARYTATMTRSRLVRRVRGKFSPVEWEYAK